MTKAKTKGQKKQAKAAAKAAPPPYVQPPDPPVAAPTAEAMAHDTFVRREVEKGGRKPYVRCEPALLDKLRMLTRQQREAGHRFAQDYVFAWGTGYGRNILDMSPRGHAHETQTQAEAWVRAKDRLHTVLNKAGPGVYAVLVQVCAFEEALGEQRRNRTGYERLILGLDECAVAYGVPAYGEEA